MGGHDRAHEHAGGTSHKKKKGKDDEHEVTPQEQSDASSALQVAADILQNGYKRMIDGAPPRYVQALWELYGAKHGSIIEDKKYNGEQRLASLDMALAGLRPALTIMKADPDQAHWVGEQITPYIEPVRQSAILQQANDRVDNSVTVDGKVVEIPTDDHPREQAALLRSQIPKLISTLSQINELTIRLGHDAIHHAAKEMFEGEGKHAKGFGKWAGNLVELQSVLLMANGWLTLSDKEFQEELHHIQGFFNGVATYTELVKAVVEITGGGVALTASFAAVIAKMSGDEALMLSAQGVARSTGLMLANVVAGIEIVWGIATLLDPHASSEKKEEAGLAVASGAAWFIGGGPAAAGVAGAYLLLKFMSVEYWAALTGINAGWLRPCFEYMQQEGQSFATEGDAVFRAHELLLAEKDKDKAAAMAKVEEEKTARLQRWLDSFLDNAAHGNYPDTWKPGGWKTLKGKFAPLQKYKGATDRETTVEGAGKTLEAIIWCLKNAGDIVLAESKQMSISELEAYEEQKAKKAEGGGEE
ncbi:MAG TPA: hypothetical protein VL463_30815 [Kofleriaceae bacterium]|nr:hypothetical protein [Kofleriaceae bacterium]